MTTDRCKWTDGEYVTPGGETCDTPRNAHCTARSTARTRTNGHRSAARVGSGVECHRLPQRLSDRLNRHTEIRGAA